MRCLRREPAERYQTAAELVEDLGRFERGEPVRVRDHSATERLSMWANRNRGTAIAAATAALLLLAVTAVSTTSAFRINAAYLEAISLAMSEKLARLQAQTERKEAIHQRDRALSYYRMAREAVDTYTVKVTHDPRLHEHDLESLRTDLLKAARPFYEELVRSEPESADDRTQRGKALGQLGHLLELVGSKQEAIAALAGAIKDFAALAVEHPAETEYRELLAETQLNLSTAFIDLERYEGAIAPCREAVRLYTELDRDNPGSPTYEHGRAVTLDNLGIVLMSTGQHGPAEEAYTTVLELRRKLLDGEPRNRKYQLELAGTYTNRGASSGVPAASI